MSRASELASHLERMASIAPVGFGERDYDLEAAAELRRLERLNAELVEASMEARRLNALGLDCEDVLSAALTSTTKEAP